MLRFSRLGTGLLCSPLPICISFTFNVSILQLIQRVVFAALKPIITAATVSLKAMLRNLLLIARANNLVIELILLSVRNRKRFGDRLYVGKNDWSKRGLGWAGFCAHE